MTLHAKNLLIEMREYAKAKIRNADLSPFVPSTEELRKLYNEVSCVDMSLYADDAVIKDLEKMTTNESLNYSDKSQKIAEDSAEEVEKIDEDSTDKEKQKVIDRLNSDRKKNIDMATDKIDRVYDKLINAVEKHPDKTDGILKVSDIFTKGFEAVLNAIMSFIQEVIKTLVTIAKTIWEFIKSTFENIVKAITGWFPSSALA